MKITLSDDLTLELRFAHPTDFYLDETTKFAGLGGKQMKVRYTHCEIFKLDEADEPCLISEGVAKCSAGDNFQKKVGRKIALTRALNKAGLSKAERSLVWLGYLLRNVKPMEAEVVH